MATNSVPSAARPASVFSGLASKLTAAFPAARPALTRPYLIPPPISVSIALPKRSGPMNCDKGLKKLLTFPRAELLKLFRQFWLIAARCCGVKLFGATNVSMNHGDITRS